MEEYATSLSPIRPLVAYSPLTLASLRNVLCTLW